MGSAVSHAGADCAGRFGRDGQPRFRMIVLPVALEGVPTQDPPATASALLSLAEQSGQEIPTGELAHGFMQRLGASPGQDFVLTNGDSLGWRILEVSLRSACAGG